MLPGLSEIKTRRKLHGLTQSELAAQSNVSQSLVAKLEAGKLVPTYDKAKRIFDALERMHEETRLRAKDVMTRKVLFVSEKDTVKKAVKLLEKNALSQLPVVEKGQSIGLVTEKGVLAKVGAGTDIDKAVVADIMEETLPTVQESTPIDIVSQLLNYSPAVLVRAKGKIQGITTKADLLKRMFKG